MSVQILWIRHAHSCGNAKSFSKNTKLYQAVFLQTLNPQISDLGIMQVEQAQQALSPAKRSLGEFLAEQVDMVCSSNMMRAIETAYRLFPEQSVTVLPYVGEHVFSELARKMNWDVENQAEDEPRTLERLKAFQYDTTRIDYRLYNKVAAEYQDWVLRPDLRHFLERVVWHHWFNVHSSYQLPPSPVAARPLRVAIVTHGNFLLDMIRHHTSTPDRLWNDQPYFQPLHCARPDYRVERPAIGNIGMVTTVWTRDVVQNFIFHSRPNQNKKNPTPHKLPPVGLVYETNAVYDPLTQSCLEYDGKRFVTYEHGYRHHVRRCQPAIRHIPTLLSKKAPKARATTSTTKGLARLK